MTSLNHARRILVVADLHYDLRQFDWLVREAGQFDLAVIAGDLLDLGGHADLDTQTVVVLKYLDRLRERLPVLVSSGNHDGDTKTPHDEFIAQWLLNSSAANLHVDHQSVLIDDLLITICPWWDGPVTRAAMVGFLERENSRRPGKWIWIHHAPPHEHPVSWTGSKFAGDAFLNELIDKFRPDFVFSGHIHNSPFFDEGSWIARIGSTWAFNPGRMIGPTPPHIILDLDLRSARWISAWGTKEMLLDAPTAGAPA